MINFSIKRGNEANLINLPLLDGQLIVAEDTGKIFFDTIIDETLIRKELNGLGDLLVETTTDTISWDGNIEGRTSVNIPDMGSLYLVSENVPTINDFAEGFYVGMVEPSGENEMFVPAEEAMDMGNIISIGGSMIVVASEDNATLDSGDSIIQFPKAGIYFFAEPGIAHVAKLKFPNNILTITRVNPKYLPDEVTTNSGTDTVNWEWTERELIIYNGYYKKISDVIPSLDDFSNGYYFGWDDYLTGNRYDNIFGKVHQAGDFILAEPIDVVQYRNVSPFIVVLEDNATIENVTFPEKGFYFLYNYQYGTCIEYVKIPGYTGFPALKLKDKLLPVHGHMATEILFSGTKAGLEAKNIQDAIDELAAGAGDGGSGFYVGDEEPADAEDGAVWLDTDDETIEVFNSDWDINDENTAGFIKNRPFYDDGSTVVQLDEKFIPDTIARVADISSGLPEYTAADEGGFLRIIDGAPAWSLLDRVEEVEF